MNRSWQARLAGSALRRGLLVTGLAGCLAGCGGDSSSPQPAESYPNLGTVPQAAPATSTTDERQQITAGLVADQQNAAYSDQALTAQSEQQSNALPTPVTTFTPSSATTADASGSQNQTSGAPAPANPPPVPAVTQTQIPAAPQPTSGITPLAPPPNPLPTAQAPAQMASAWPQPPVYANQAQLGAATAREQLYPAPNAPFYGAPSVPAYSASYAGSAPAALPPAGAPIAVIFFENSSSALSNRAMSVLKDVALIQQQQGGQIRIIGHASERTAPVSYGEHDVINQKLSLARANSVARALIGFGAPQGTISVAAVGSQQPVYPEFMPTGEAGNRRVEVFLYR